MYVFYPADELLRIYENPIRESVSLTVNDAAVNGDYVEINQQHYQQRIVVTNDVRKRKEKKRDTSQTAGSRRQIVRNGDGDAGKKEGRRNEEQHARTMQSNRASGSEEAANHPLKDLTQPSLNEPLKQHNGVALKLVQTEQSYSLNTSNDFAKTSKNVAEYTEI
ncbi:PREDICTED: uncharacterized protein LOC108780852 [Cyphomyrmex costatus]|uniref:uncharacterized protein LOC108780852 n=1 Tax=Cyphomyrmex costatus TaxID=456900 RepID=UPI0008523B33|nr:PREDICTED: uncharacterized protein LOC108780852 [Cyphomyrmex costatus]